MMEHLEKDISYVEGLLEGLDLDPTSKEGRAIFELIELNKKIIDEIRDLKLRYNDHEEFIEALDEDLYEVESFLFEEERMMKDEEDSVEEDGYFEMECPNCEELILVDEKGLKEGEEVELICPECKETILLRFGEDESEEGRRTSKDMEEPMRQ